MTDPWQNWLNADERAELAEVEALMAASWPHHAKRTRLRRRAERRRQRANAVQV